MNAHTLPHTHSLTHTHTHTHTLACPDELFLILSKCWQKEQAARPCFQEVNQMLRDLRLEAEQKNPPARDVGAELNSLLNQNLKRLSKKATMLRKSKVRTGRRESRRRESAYTHVHTHTRANSLSFSLRSRRLSRDFRRRTGKSRSSPLFQRSGKVRRCTCRSCHHPLTRVLCRGRGGAARCRERQGRD